MLCVYSKELECPKHLKITNQSNNIKRSYMFEYNIFALCELKCCSPLLGFDCRDELGCYDL